MKVTKGMTWPLLLLALASITVFLAGIASLQSTCQEAGSFPLARGVTSTPNGAFGMSSSFGECRRVMRFYWFSWAFVFVTLLSILVTSFMGMGLHFSRPFWIGMLSVSTILMMIASEAFLGWTDLAEASNLGGVRDNTAPYYDSWIRRFRLATAGAILTTIFLVLLMMALGTDWEHRRGTVRDDKVVHTHGHGVMHTPGTVPVSDARIVDRV